jgi:flavin reductase (DIM6/NTAB) family NADH-FMN oxidoreductase RutF
VSDGVEVVSDGVEVVSDGVEVVSDIAGNRTGGVRDAGSMSADTPDDPIDDPTDTPFDELMASLDAPMFILTAHDGSERSGCLVGFATQVSIRPPRFLVMVSKQNHTYGVAREAAAVVVHVLRAGDEDLARHFGELTGDEVDKFEGLDVVDGPARAPVLVGLDWFAGRVLDTIDLGDHLGLLLAPHDGSATRVGEPQYGLREALDLEPGHGA